MLLIDGPRQHHNRTCATRHQRKPSRRRGHASQRAKRRAEPPNLDSQSRTRCDSSATLAPNVRATRMSLDTSPGHASAGPRASANNTGRDASETTVRAPRTTWRHASTTSASDASNASTSSRQEAVLHRSQADAPLGLRTSAALATSAANAGIRAARAARSARASAVRRRLGPQASHRNSRDH